MIIAHRNCIWAIDLSFPFISFQLVECCLGAAIFCPHCSGYFFGPVWHVAPPFFSPLENTILLKALTLFPSSLVFGTVPFYTFMILSNWDRLSTTQYHTLHQTKFTISSLSCCAVLCVYPYCCDIVCVLSQVLVPIHSRGSSSFIGLNTMGC
jgi:hypothetical protein